MQRVCGLVGLLRRSSFGHCDVMLFSAAEPAAGASFAEFSDFQSASSNKPTV